MTKRISRYSVISILSILSALTSCNSNITYSDSIEIADKTWNLLDIKRFDIPVADTVTSNDIFFNIRTGSSYPFRNIFLFVSTTSPDGKRISDTLQYFLADEKGKWFGKGFGDIHELILPYKSNVFFPQKGKYHIEIQHGMRSEDLKGVYDIGVRIEKTRK